MTISIEKDVPIPPPGSGSRKYPFGEMRVGDSFALPLSGELVSVGVGKADQASVRLSRCAYAYGARHGLQFTVRTLKGDGVVRCWRVS